MNHEKTEILDIIPPKNSKKKDENTYRILLISIISIVIIIIGIVGYNQFKNDKDQENNNSNANINNISEEIKKELANKTRIMLTSLYDYDEIYKSGDYSINYDFWEVNSEVLFYNELTNIQKLVIALKYATKAESPHCIEIACSEVTKEDLEKAYYYLFNENPIHQSIDYFPRVEYSEQDSMYYLYYYDGIEHEPVRFLTYINRFEKEEDLYNVYINVGLNLMEDNYNIYAVKLYNNGQDHAPEFKRLLEVDENEVYFRDLDKNNGEFYITKDNYDKFSEYKLTFEMKDNGKLIFKSSTKTK